MDPAYPVSSECRDLNMKEEEENGWSPSRACGCRGTRLTKNVPRFPHSVYNSQRADQPYLSEVIPKFLTWGCVQPTAIAAVPSHARDSVPHRPGSDIIPVYPRTPTLVTDPSSLQQRHPPIILASTSSSRLALVQAAGLSVIVRKPSVDEDLLKREARAEGLQAADAALMLAERKAQSVWDQPGIDPDALIIGADQLLVCDGHWHDKPIDLGAARTQLQALSGRTHVLHTAVVCCRRGEIVWRHVAAPALSMRRLTDAFLDTYLSIEAEHVLYCVGAYRLEGPGIHLFDTVEGEHAAILGLPLLALLAFLRWQDVLIA